MTGLRHLEAKIVGSYDGRWSDIESAFAKTAKSLDPNVTVRLHPIEESVSTALIPAKMSSAAGMVLSAFALILAASGIYGVVAFAITRRRKEMGIRVALGAERGSVLRLMLWQGMQPVLAGTVLGFALAAAAANLIRAMLYGVSPFDPVALATTAGILVAVAGLAALLPARSAMQVNPASVLREE
jgi:putative ABC transport system permease protein